MAGSSGAGSSGSGSGALLALTEGIGGAQGGVLAGIAVIPLEIVVFRQGADPTGKSTLLGIARDIWRQNGLRGFLPLRVIVANSVEDIVKKGCFYIIYVLVKRAYEAAFGSLAGRYLHNLVVGYLTALLNSVPILPFETLSTRVMTDTQNQGALSITWQIWRERGLLGFYEGWEAYPLLSLKPAIQETIIDQSKIAFLSWVGRSGLRGAEGFALGGWGRVLTTMLMYPVFKVRLLIASGNMKGLGVAATARKIVGEQGIKGLYAGMAPELVRGTLYQCFLTGSKELLDGANGRMLAALFSQ